MHHQSVQRVGSEREFHGDISSQSRQGEVRVGFSRLGARDLVQPRLREESDQADEISQGPERRSDAEAVVSPDKGLFITTINFNQ